MAWGGGGVGVKLIASMKGSMGTCYKTIFFSEMRTFIGGLVIVLYYIDTGVLLEIYHA